MLTNIENNGEKSDETDKSIVEHMKKILHDTRIYLLSLTVEPICVLIYFGWVFGNTIQSPGLYRRVCEIYYMDDPNVDCYHIDKDHVENNVQRHASLWTLYNALAYLVPAIFADTILGAYGDKHGRKINILLGIAGIAFSEFGYMLTLSDSVHTPYWTTLVFGIFTGATGYIALIPVSCNAYLADITADPDLLTIRSGILSMIQGFSCVIGGYSAALVGNIAIAKAMDVELATYLLALLYTLWRIPQRPGIRELERRSRGLAKEDWMLYVAQFVGCFGGLIQPAVVSYIVQIVPYEEVGRAFSLFGIGANFAYIITNAIYSPIYSATEAWFPGFLFIIITAIQAIAGLAMLWVHFKSKSEGIGKPKEQKRDIQKAISEIGSEPHEDGIFFTHNSRPDKHLTIYDHALERDQLKVDELWGSMSDDGRERMGSFF
uniref:Proton-coupled folate transporter n=1 Tax=Acrobeloides nanus TaxID=290746 RepID=A0A914D0R3_9BILA